jgi:hypothetical protein
LLVLAAILSVARSTWIKHDASLLVWLSWQCVQWVTKGCHADSDRLFHERCWFITTWWWEFKIISPVRNALISKSYKFGSGLRFP